MRTTGLVIFDAFSTLVTSRPDSRQTFRTGLRRAGVSVSEAEQLLPVFQATGIVGAVSDTEFTECEAGEWCLR
ncbi:MAG TPA: hypothetical protein VMH35_28155 [Streptosporangiaceae bacterium]|nr:hypothetical protein [Streptosporangiaceae bacterium]